MLDRITNINPDSNYRNEKHTGNFLPAFSKAIKHHEQGSDAIKISPAMIYILGKGWRLKELKELAARKISIKFLFKDFEFHTDIDFDKIVATKKLTYSIIKEKNHDGKISKVLLSLIYNIDRNFEINENDAILLNLKGMEILFDRIERLDLQMEINHLDTYAISNLMDEIYHDLVSELSYITSTLLILFEKMTQINCRFIKQEEDILEIIRLEKINTINVDKV